MCDLHEVRGCAVCLGIERYEAPEVAEGKDYVRPQDGAGIVTGPKRPAVTFNTRKGDYNNVPRKPNENSNGHLRNDRRAPVVREDKVTIASLIASHGPLVLATEDEWRFTSGHIHYPNGEPPIGDRNQKLATKLGVTL